MKPTRPALLVSVATAFSLLGDQTLYSVLPTYYTELGMVPYQVGLILSVNRWIRLLTNHFAERLCRRHNLVLLLGLALGCGALTTAVYGVSTFFPLLLFARIVWGLCWSFIRQIGLMTVVDSAVQGHIGQLMGFYSGISRIGSISGNLLGALGHDIWGFAPILFVFAALSLAAVPLGIKARRGVRSVERENLETPAKGPVGVSLLACGFAVGCTGQGLVAATLGLMLKNQVGDSVQVLGIGIGVATLTGITLAGRWIADLIAPLLGAFSDRWGRRLGAFVFFQLGALALGLAAWGEGALVMVFLVLSFFLCATGVSVVLLAEAGLRGPRAVASYVTASDLGSAVGPMLGWLAPQWGLPSAWAFGLGAGLYLVAGWVSLGTIAQDR